MRKLIMFITFTSILLITFISALFIPILANANTIPPASVGFTISFNQGANTLYGNAGQVVSTSFQVSSDSNTAMNYEVYPVGTVIGNNGRMNYSPTPDIRFKNDLSVSPSFFNLSARSEQQNITQTVTVSVTIPSHLEAGVYPITFFVKPLPNQGGNIKANIGQIALIYLTVQGHIQHKISTNFNIPSINIGFGDNTNFTVKDIGKSSFYTWGQVNLSSVFGSVSTGCDILPSYNPVRPPTCKTTSTNGSGLITQTGMIIDRFPSSQQQELIVANKTRNWTLSWHPSFGIGIYKLVGTVFYNITPSTSGQKIITKTIFVISPLYLIFLIIIILLIGLFIYKKKSKVKNRNKKGAHFKSNQKSKSNQKNKDDIKYEQLKKNKEKAEKTKKPTVSITT